MDRGPGLARASRSGRCAQTRGISPPSRKTGVFTAVDISIPVAVTVFPGEIYQAPRSWAEQNYHQLIDWHEVEKGGHFAAWEQPELFATELRAAFRSLR